jgi:hypothetical protein
MNQPAFGSCLGRITARQALAAELARFANTAMPTSLYGPIDVLRYSMAKTRASAFRRQRAGSTESIASAARAKAGSTENT